MRGLICRVQAVNCACRQGIALAEEKQIGFEEYINGDSMWIQGDPASLRRLFLILIDNAVKYTPANGKVEVSLQRNNGYAVAQVRDNGIGIAESDLPNVFERFYRADKARTRELGGVGLGLLFLAALLTRGFGLLGGPGKAAGEPESMVRQGDKIIIPEGSALRRAEQIGKAHSHGEDPQLARNAGRDSTKRT